MKTVNEIRTDVTRRLARTWPAALAAQTAAAVDGWPHAFPLGQPTRAELAGQFADVVRTATELRAWADQHHLEITVRARRVHGTEQELPTHLTVPDIDTAAELAAGDWPECLARGRRRAAVLAAQFPSLANPAQTLATVEGLSDIDFDLACRAGRWFAMHDPAGLTPRQVPVEGLHAKWLNTRQVLVKDLAGIDDLQLAAPHPARLHFTYLDPEHRRAGYRLHDSASVGDVPTLAYRPQIVVISENKDTALYFPELPGAVSVEGVGKGGATAAKFAWLVNAPLVVYWGGSRPESATAGRRKKLALIIARIFEDSDSAYGYRRIAAVLARQGTVACPELVRKLMRELGLVACQPRPWRPATTKQGQAGPIPDLVNRDFAAEIPGQKMVGDITYIPTWQGWAFLATVIDCATRKCVGWAVDDNYRTPLITAAIQMASRNIELPCGAVFHSDRGSN